MGNGRLLIGEGLGDATVLNTQPIAQGISQYFAQKSAKREQERQALVQQMGQLKTDGLRDADKNDYYNKYNEWKNTAIQANNAPNSSRQKLDLQGAALQKYNQLNEFVSKSKQAQTDYHQNANQLHNDAMRHQFKDDAVNNFLAVKDLPMNDPKFQQYSDLNNLERQVDHNKVDQVLERAKDQALEPVIATKTQAKGTKAGMNGVYIDTRKVIPYDGENGVYHRLLNAYSTDDNTAKSIDDRYKDIQGESPQETKALRVAAYAKDKGWDKGWVKPVGSPEFTQSIQDKNRNALNQHAMMRQYDIANPVREPKVEDVPATPTDITIPYNGGKSNVQAKGYVPLSLPDKNYAGQAAYNLSTGQPVKALASSSDYKTVGVANFPFVKSGKYAGSIAQPNFVKDHPNEVEYKPMVHVQKKGEFKEDPNEDFVIDYNKLPANIKNSKPVQSALRGFQPAGATQAPSQTSEVVTVRVNGKTGQIPKAKLKEFLKKYPTAKY